MATALLSIVGLYAVTGLMVGLAFVLRGVVRVDPVVGDSSFVFRVVIFPGCVGLWPAVLWLWIKAGRGGAS